MSQEGLFAGNVEPVQLEEEIQRSYLDYAMSVIVSRALPEVRDGLKPVHRRMLWSMLEGGLRPDRPHRKSAWAVGEVVKAGRTVGLTQARVTDEGGSLVAHATSTCMTLRGEAAEGR